MHWDKKYLTKIFLLISLFNMYTCIYLKCTYIYIYMYTYMAHYHKDETTQCWVCVYNLISLFFCFSHLAHFTYFNRVSSGFVFFCASEYITNVCIYIYICKEMSWRSCVVLWCAPMPSTPSCPHYIAKALYFFFYS